MSSYLLSHEIPTSITREEDVIRALKESACKSCIKAVHATMAKWAPDTTFPRDFGRFTNFCDLQLLSPG